MAENKTTSKPGAKRRAATKKPAAQKPVASAIQPATTAPDPGMPENPVTPPAQAPVVQKALDKAPDPVPAVPAKETANKTIERYMKRYPKENEFYMTTDGNVFLAGNQAMAKAHQRTIGDGSGVVKIFKRGNNG